MKHSNSVRLRVLAFAATLIAAGAVLEAALAADGQPQAKSSCGNVRRVDRPAQWLWWYRGLCGRLTQFEVSVAGPDGATTTFTFGEHDSEGQTAPPDPNQPAPAAGNPAPANQPPRPAAVVIPPAEPPDSRSPEEVELAAIIGGEGAALIAECVPASLGTILFLAGLLEAIRSRAGARSGSKSPR